MDTSRDQCRLVSRSERKRIVLIMNRRISKEGRVTLQTSVTFHGDFTE